MERLRCPNPSTDKPLPLRGAARLHSLSIGCSIGMINWLRSGIIMVSMEVFI
jgi:hypothetical protein